MQYPCNIFIRRSVKITHCDSVILKWKVPEGGGGVGGAGVGGAKQPPFAMVTSSIAISPDQDLPLTPSNVTWTWKKIISLLTNSLDTNSLMEPFRAFSFVLQKFDQISNNLSACFDHIWHILPEPYNSPLGTRRFRAYSQDFHEKSWR